MHLIGALPTRIRSAWKISGFARVDNITGTRYAGAVIVNEANGRFYEPSPGRNYMVGLNASDTF